MQKTKLKEDFAKFKKDYFQKRYFKKDIKLNVANAALRTVDFKGGLDKFLLSANKSKLSKK